MSLKCDGRTLKMFKIELNSELLTWLENAVDDYTDKSKRLTVRVKELEGEGVVSKDAHLFWNSTQSNTAMQSLLLSSLVTGDLCHHRLRMR